MPRTSFPFVSVAAGVFLLTAPHAAFAQTYTNDTGGSVTFYGQFSPTFLFFDDGVEQYSNLADNANSNSRLGFNLDQDLNGNRFRFTFEAAIGFPQTSDYSQDGDDPFWEWQNTDLRKFEVRYRGGFGEVYLGQGSMATDGSAGADLSGTTIAGTSAIPDSAGSYQFRDDDTRALTGVALEDVFENLDGSRRFRIRYDTPRFNGFSGAVAYGTNELSEGDEDLYYDLALYYEGEAGDVEMEGSIGYAWRDRDQGDTDENWVGSFALLHTPTGLNFAIAGGGEQDGGQYGYIKAGYRADFFDVGSTNFAVDYYSGSDFNTDGSNASQWGFQAVQRWDDLGLEGYIGIRTYSLDDDTGVEYRDAHSGLLGGRWRF